MAPSWFVATTVVLFSAAAQTAESGLEAVLVDDSCAGLSDEVCAVTLLQHRCAKVVADVQSNNAEANGGGEGLEDYVANASSKASTVNDTVNASAFAGECDCFHNGDAGRWRDSESPAGRIALLCAAGGGCHTSLQGASMRVMGNVGMCSCLSNVAANWQSWHGDWFLWSVIQCPGIMFSITR